MLTAAIALFAFLPSGAGAMDITNFTMTPSTTQAAGHPTVAFSFERKGSETDDLSQAILELPAGMFQNPENALKKSSPTATPTSAKCTESQFVADTCPIQSELGSMSVDIKAASLLNLNVPGSIYMMEGSQAPNNTAAATLGLKMRPAKICILFIFCAVPDKVSLKTTVVVNTFDDDDGLKTYTKNAPRTTTLGIPPIVKSGGISLDITINKMALTFNQYYSRPAKSWSQSTANYNLQHPLRYSMVQGTACDRPSIAKLTAVSVSGQSFVVGTSKPNGASAPQPEPRFTPTGCANVPFTPTLSFNPLDKRANQPSAVEFKMFVPQADATIQNAHPKIVDVDFPKGSGIDLSELAGVDGCDETQLKADQCPADSIIGNAGSNAPYLPPALTGTVYAMNPIGNTVPMAVVLRGVRGSLVIFRGTLGVRDPGNGVVGNTYARFDKIPQLPYADVSVNLTKKLYKNPNPTDVTQCTDPTKLQLITSTITGFNGKVANPGASYRLTDCNVPPTTTITNGPTNPTSDNRPVFSFQADQPGTSFVCKVDNLPTVPCNDNNQTVGSTTTGSFRTEPLSNATHSFEVYAVNGVASGAPAVYPPFVVNSVFRIEPTITSTTKQAAGNPDLTTAFNIVGGQPKNIQIKLPAGFAASLAARPLCSAADAAAGTCASTSEIGDVSLTVGVSGGGTASGTGKAYLTEGPNATTDAGGVAVKVNLPGIGDYIAGAGAYLVENGKHQYIDIRTIPTSVNGVSTSVQSMSIAWDGDNNGLITNASSCAPGQFLVTGTRTDDVPAESLTVPYTSENCGAVPFNPTVNQSFSNLAASTDEVDNFSSAVADVSLPAGNSSIKTMVVSEPASLTPNYGSFGAKADQCKAGSAVDTDPSAAVNYAFNYSPAAANGTGGNCPPQALVGEMTINTPLLPSPLVGRVYLVDRSPLPWFGVIFDQPGIKIGLVGVTSLPVNPSGYQQITVTFDNVPDTPVSSVNFALDGPDRTSPTLGSLSGKLLAIGRFDDPACVPGSLAVATLTGWSGATATRTQPIAFTGCNP